MPELRAYMAFDRCGGPWEWAVPVFAYSHREARRVAWPLADGFGCDFTDLRVRRLDGDGAHLRREDGPHFVEDPPLCRDCEHWHASPLDANGRCPECAEWFDAD